MEACSWLVVIVRVIVWEVILLAYVDFSVEKYGVILGSPFFYPDGVEVFATIGCMAKDVRTGSLMIYFVDQKVRLPCGTFSAPKQGRMWVPDTHYSWYVDLLRNEKPVIASLMSEAPFKHQLKVREVVGEGE